MKREYVLKVFKEWLEETIEHIHTNTKEGSYDRKYSEAPIMKNDPTYMCVITIKDGELDK